MSMQFIIWGAVALLALSLIIVKSLSSITSSRRATDGKKSSDIPRERRFKLIEGGGEWEEFYVPGDRRFTNGDTYDYGE